METTTLTAFWQGFVTTTAETIVANHTFFTGILISVIIMMCLGGLFYGFTYAFRKRKRL
jgi:hypothetical protein